LFIKETIDTAESISAANSEKNPLRTLSEARIQRFRSKEKVGAPHQRFIDQIKGNNLERSK